MQNSRFIDKYMYLNFNVMTLKWSNKINKNDTEDSLHIINDEQIYPQSTCMNT
jgi:hypothetical protein